MNNRVECVSELKELLTRVQYKPGYKLKVAFDPDSLQLICDVKEEDSEHLGKEVTLEGKCRIPWAELDCPKEKRRECYIEALHQHLLCQAEHEVNEWLRIDGVKLFDPHNGMDRKLELLRKLMQGAS